jgi:hypothetical protein
MTQTIETETNTGTRITVDEMSAELILLGYAEPAADDDSKRFEEGVLQANPEWKPGVIPRVPPGYRSGEALRRSSKPVRQARPPAQSRAERAKRGPSRETRGTRRRATARAPSGQDDSDPEPPKRGAGGRPPVARQDGAGDARQLAALDVVERADAAWRIISANPRLYDARERFDLFKAAGWPLESRVRGA